jgi:dipeptidase
MPNEIGGLIWAGLAATASSPHIPFYACHKDTPSAYKIGIAGDNSVYLPDSAYWLFENIGNIMNLFYDGTVDLVKPVWEDFDHRRYEFQNSIEQIALNLYKEDKQKMIDFLTSYSNGVALEALEVGQDMLAKLFTRLAMVNNPQTTRGYENPAEWKKSGFIY